jgi:hypothetical protein
MILLDDVIHILAGPPFAFLREQLFLFQITDGGAALVMRGDGTDTAVSYQGHPGRELIRGVFHLAEDGVDRILKCDRRHLRIFRMQRISHIAKHTRMPTPPTYLKHTH